MSLRGDNITSLLFGRSLPEPDQQADCASPESRCTCTTYASSQEPAKEMTSGCLVKNTEEVFVGQTDDFLDDWAIIRGIVHLAFKFVSLLHDASGHSNVLKAEKAEELKTARKRRTARKADKLRV